MKVTVAMVIENKTQLTSNAHVNTLNLKARNEKICKLKCYLKNTNLRETDKERLLNAFVNVNDKGFYFHFKR